MSSMSDPVFRAVADHLKAVGLPVVQIAYTGGGCEAIESRFTHPLFGPCYIYVTDSDANCPSVRMDDGEDYTVGIYQDAEDYGDDISYAWNGQDGYGFDAHFPTALAKAFIGTFGAFDAQF